MPSHRRIRLLIADDSRFIRMALRSIVDEDPCIDVVGEARDGADAIALARVLRPDIITMDLEMPGIDGLDAIGAIMAERPVPIIVLSGHTRAGVWTTFQALGRGAVDFLEKPDVLEAMDTRGIDREILAKIHQWAHRPHTLLHHSGGTTRRRPEIRPEVQPSAQPGNAMKPVAPANRPYRPLNCDLVVVAVSTGGPNTLPLMLAAMGGPLRCPMVVAQHMPSLFTCGFAEHLSTSSGLDVVEGSNDMPLSAGSVVIINGGCDGEVVRTAGGLRLRQRRADLSGIHPSGDVLFESAVNSARLPIAVVLTGIGSDGTNGARHFATRQFPVFAQEPNSAVVWGMPSSVIDAGYATDVLMIEEIGAELSRMAGVPSARVTS